MMNNKINKKDSLVKTIREIRDNLNLEIRDMSFIQVSEFIKNQLSELKSQRLLKQKSI